MKLFYEMSSSKFTLPVYYNLFRQNNLFSYNKIIAIQLDYITQSNIEITCNNIR